MIASLLLVTDLSTGTVLLKAGQDVELPLAEATEVFGGIMET